MKMSRKSACMLGTLVFICCVCLNVELLQEAWHSVTHHTKSAYRGRWFASISNSTKANTSGRLLSGGINIVDDNFRSLNMFTSENANIFSRFIKFNVHNDGRDCSHRRFLIYTCKAGGYTCGGWGDRLKGITSTFLLALLTNRTFLIDLSKPCEISKLVRPNIYDWNKCLDVARTIPSRNTLSEISRERIDNMLVGGLSKKPVVRVTTFQQDNHKIRNHNMTREVMPWIYTLSDAEIIGSIIGTLFKPSPELSQQLVKFSTEKIQGRRLVCTHIRTGRNPTIPRDSDLPKGTPNVSTVLDFLQKYDQKPDTAMFVATDSMRIRNKSRVLFSNFISTEANIMHVDYAGKGSEHELCGGFFDVLLDQLILSRCDVLLLTRSNFGAMAAYMRGESSGLFLHIIKPNMVKRVNLHEVQTIYKFV